MVRIRNAYKGLANGIYVTKSIIKALLLALWLFLFMLFSTGNIFVSVALLLIVFALAITPFYTFAPLAFRVVRINEHGILQKKLFVKWSDIEYVKQEFGYVRFQYGSKKIDDLFGSSTYIDIPVGIMITVNSDFFGFKQKGTVCFSKNAKTDAILRKYSSVYATSINPYDRREQKNGRHKISKRKIKKLIYNAFISLISIVAFTALLYFAFYPNVWQVAVTMIPLVLFEILLLIEISFHR